MPEGAWEGARWWGGGGVVVYSWRETQVPIGGFQRPLGPQDGFGPGVSGLAWRDVGVMVLAWLLG